MKKITLLVLFFVSNVSFSQSFHANLKATGLTCAMCSYSTQSSLEKQDFISSITPDLEETSFLLEFRDDKFIDFDLIQEKVEDAGFFVGEIEIIFSDEVVAENDLHSVFNGNLFHFFTENKSQTNKKSPGRLIPASVKFEVYQRDKGRCVECGETSDLHYDHILPYSKGGSSTTSEDALLL